MATVVTFIDGTNKHYDADSAALVGPLFVLYRYNRKRRKLESGEAFPAEQVRQAQLPNGNIVVGRGSLTPK
jgi:hypothetical protein